MVSPVVSSLLLSCAAVAMVSLADAAARADVALHWDAPAECPSSDSVLEATVRMAGPQALARGELEADAEVRRESGGYALVLSLESEAGQSELRVTAQRCESLVEVVALQLALAAETKPAPATTRAVEARPRAGERTNNESAKSISVTKPHEQAMRALLGLSAGGGLGFLPGVSGAFRGYVGTEFGWMRLELGGTYFLPKQSSYTDVAQGPSARFDLLAAEVRGCLRPAPRGVSVSLCVGTAAGALRGRAEGGSQPRTSRQAWLSFVGAGRLHYQVAGSFGMLAELGLSVATRRPPFYYRNLGNLFQPGRVGGLLWLGGEARF